MRAYKAMLFPDGALEVHELRACYGCPKVPAIIAGSDCMLDGRQCFDWMAAQDGVLYICAQNLSELYQLCDSKVSRMCDALASSKPTGYLGIIANLLQSQRHRYAEGPTCHGIQVVVAEEAKAGVRAVNDPLLAEVEDGLQAPRLLVLLNAEPTSENVGKLISAVQSLQQSDMPETVLEYLCGHCQFES